jgi:hypothetical protein
MPGAKRTERCAGHGAGSRCHGEGLFLETSAQIARLLESKSIRSDIEGLCGRFARVGTSAFALAEFEANIGGFMKTVAAALTRSAAS